MPGWRDRSGMDSRQKTLLGKSLDSFSRLAPGSYLACRRNGSSPTVRLGKIGGTIDKSWARWSRVIAAPRKFPPQIFRFGDTLKRDSVRHPGSLDVEYCWHCPIRSGTQHHVSGRTYLAQSHSQAKSRRRVLLCWMSRLACRIIV